MRWAAASHGRIPEAPHASNVDVPRPPLYARRRKVFSAENSVGRVSGHHEHRASVLDDLPRRSFGGMSAPF